MNTFHSHLIYFFILLFLQKEFQWTPPPHLFSSNFLLIFCFLLFLSPFPSLLLSSSSSFLASSSFSYYVSSSFPSLSFLSSCPFHFPYFISSSSPIFFYFLFLSPSLFFPPPLCFKSWHSHHPISLPPSLPSPLPLRYGSFVCFYLYWCNIRSVSKAIIRSSHFLLVWDIIACGCNEKQCQGGYRILSLFLINTRSFSFLFLSSLLLGQLRILLEGINNDWIININFFTVVNNLARLHKYN